MPLKATERDVYEFFSKAGKVSGNCFLKFFVFSRRYGVVHIFLLVTTCSCDFFCIFHFHLHMHNCLMCLLLETLIQILMRVIEINFLPVAVNAPLPSVTSNKMTFLCQHSVYVG